MNREKPALVRQSPGASIEIEVWELEAGAFGSLVADIPPPLGIGTLELDDGEKLKGLLCEQCAVAGLEDISHYGGWRAYAGGASLP